MVDDAFNPRTAQAMHRSPSALSTRLACALIAYSVHEHQEGHVSRIDVRIGPRRCVVEDDGRGMGLDREGYAQGLMGLLICRCADVHLHGVGLSLVATSTPRLHIESRRDGTLWTQTFAWGEAVGPPSRIGPAAASGTCIAMDVAAEDADIEPDGVIARIEHWRAANPKLVIGVRRLQTPPEI
jgi:DNA gyrase/topoisomerase IV subunit B